MRTTTPVTADQLLRMPDDGYRYELIAGELRKTALAGWRHGATGGRLHGWLGHHIQERRLGRVFLANTGFLLARDPDTVRAPDIAFIGKDHLPASEPEEAFWPGAPDLAVEVVSPGDTLGEIDERVEMWLDAGARMVWVVNPEWRSVTVYRSATDIKTLTEKDGLEGEEVVPGFLCRIRDIFVMASAPSRGSVIAGTGNGPAVSGFSGSEHDADSWPTLADCERRLIEDTLRRTFYNQSEAARLLDIDRRLLARKIRKYRILGKKRTVPPSNLQCGST
jgi:Uma2 family endonuclease